MGDSALTRKKLCLRKLSGPRYPRGSSEVRRGYGVGKSERISWKRGGRGEAGLPLRVGLRMENVFAEGNDQCQQDVQNIVAGIYSVVILSLHALPPQHTINRTASTLPLSSQSS
jgi:hypothetical protein